MKKVVHFIIATNDCYKKHIRNSILDPDFMTSSNVVEVTCLPCAESMLEYHNKKAQEFRDLVESLKSEDTSSSDT